MSTGFRLAASAVLTVLAVACAPPPSVPADARAAAMPAMPADTDEAGLRAAVARALAEQRFHSPAGNNALEGYLVLRALRPDDADLGTAMMEMLPYAVIASEQAMARADFAEARRLTDLIARADPQAPALPRLRAAIAAREADEAQRMIAEAEAARLRAIEAERVASEAGVSEAGAPGAAPAPAVAERSAAPPPTPGVSPPAVNPAPAAAAPVIPSPAPARAAPALVSSPAPRYPVMALRRRLEGDVTVAFTVRTDGSVGDARVVAATAPDVFDEAALAAVARWRFAPAAGPQEVRRVLQFRLPRSEG